MTKFDDQYIALCKRILEHGERTVNYQKTDSRDAKTNSVIPDHAAQGRLESATIRIPHQMLQFDLEEEFPILTSKKVAFKTAVLEMLWIYQAQSNDVRWLQERNIKIWNEWEVPEGNIYQGRDFDELYKQAGLQESPTHTIGTAYGWIVKRYGLIQGLIDTLKINPSNRRMVMSLWQNEWLLTAALPSCIWNSQWSIINDRLNILVTSRSSDAPLGLPFNVAQYAVLCHMIAQCIGVRPGIMTFMINDAHLYENQIDGIKEQIARYDDAVKNHTLPKAPKLWLNPDKKDFFDFDNSKELKDIRLDNYENLGVIKMPITE